MRLMPLPPEAKAMGYHSAVAAFRRSLLVHHLARNELRTRATARALGIAPGTLLAAIKALGIRQDDFDALDTRENELPGVQAARDDATAILNVLEGGKNA